MTAKSDNYNIETANVFKLNYEELLKGYHLTDGPLLLLIESFRLTPYEVAVCFFICKHISLKDIASMLEHSYDSVKKAKHRISRKLKLANKNIDIDKYILQMLK